MRNTELDKLDGLVGQWTTTISDAWFLEPPGATVPGSTIVEWIGEPALRRRHRAGPDPWPLGGLRRSGQHVAEGLRPHIRADPSEFRVSQEETQGAGCPTLSIDGEWSVVRTPDARSPRRRRLRRRLPVQDDDVAGCHSQRRRRRSPAHG